MTNRKKLTRMTTYSGDVECALYGCEIFTTTQNVLARLPRNAEIGVPQLEELGFLLT